jgi:hypothetical protein
MKIQIRQVLACAVVSGWLATALAIALFYFNALLSGWLPVQLLVVSGLVLAAFAFFAAVALALLMYLERCPTCAARNFVQRSERDGFHRSRTRVLGSSWAGFILDAALGHDQYCGSCGGPL